MLYKLLGMAVWKGGKLIMRRKYGPTYTPKPVLAGALALVLVGVLLAANSKRDSS